MNSFKPHALYYKQTKAFRVFLDDWKSQVKRQNRDLSKLADQLETINPLFIPRNHQIEKAISGAIEGNLKTFNELYQLLKAPFKEQEKLKKYSIPPTPEERITRTYCGT